ncbi:hypothetical protein CIB48_g11293 [Xylaria polymorpha]|nr:hypothetical protein CIB48_g11293 [Xylaria polymorpha]
MIPGPKRPDMTPPPELFKPGYGSTPGVSPPSDRKGAPFPVAGDHLPRLFPVVPQGMGSIRHCEVCLVFDISLLFPQVFTVTSWFAQPAFRIIIHLRLLLLPFIGKLYTALKTVYSRKRKRKSKNRHAHELPSSRLVTRLRRQRARAINGADVLNRRSPQHQIKVGIAKLHAFVGRHQQTKSISQGTRGRDGWRPREAMDADARPPEEVWMLQFGEDERRAELREREQTAALEGLLGFAERAHGHVARVGYRLAAAELISTLPE